MLGPKNVICSKKALLEQFFRNSRLAFSVDSPAFYLLSWYAFVPSFIVNPCFSFCHALKSRRRPSHADGLLPNNKTRRKSLVLTQAEGLVTGTMVKMFTIAGPVIVSGTVASAVYGLILVLLGYGG